MSATVATRAELAAMEREQADRPLHQRTRCLVVLVREPPHPDRLTGEMHPAQYGMVTLEKFQPDAPPGEGWRVESIGPAPTGEPR